MGIWELREKTSLWHISVTIPASINLYIIVKLNKFIRSNNGRALQVFFQFVPIDACPTGV